MRSAVTAGRLDDLSGLVSLELDDAVLNSNFLKMPIIPDRTYWSGPRGQGKGWQNGCSRGWGGHWPEEQARKAQGQRGFARGRSAGVLAAKLEVGDTGQQIVQPSGGWLYQQTEVVQRERSECGFSL